VGSEILQARVWSAWEKKLEMRACKLQLSLQTRLTHGTQRLQRRRWLLTGKRGGTLTAPPTQDRRLAWSMLRVLANASCRVAAAVADTVAADTAAGTAAITIISRGVAHREAGARLAAEGAAGELQ
jgi:hypothetical protein